MHHDGILACVRTQGDDCTPASRRLPGRRHPSLGPALLGALALALGACLPGGDGDDSETGGSDPDIPWTPNPGEGEDGGPPAPTVPDGTTVAFLETRAPFIDEFLLRGTLPIPPNTFPRSNGRDIFQILDHDGTPVTTQTEIVSRYAKASEGADVVELIGWVHVPPSASPGDQVRYEVRQVQQPDFPDPPSSPTLHALADTLDVPSSIESLGNNPLGVILTTWDCYGNRYEARLFDNTGVLKVMRHGPVRTELRIAQNMTLVETVGGTPLPHGFGVHAYVSSFQGREMLGLDLRFHNGHSGQDSGTNQDDPLAQLYFEKIELSVPDDWFVDQSFYDLNWPANTTTNPTVTGNRHVYDLVKPMSNGKMHVIRWQGQFHRRLLITSAADLGHMLPYLRSGGQAFCVRDPNMPQLWSWWNRGTSRYFPQNYQLPKLNHVGLSGIRNSLGGDMAWIESHLQNGTSTGGYPIATTPLGWGHPWGVTYGGMTGGAEIHLYEGVDVAASASSLGYRYYQGLFRMHMDRHPAALYDAEGEPSTIEDWLQGSGSNAFVPFDFFLNPANNTPHFQTHAAANVHANHVASNNLAPSYEGLHFSYDPHDFQHFIRYTRAPKALIWLGNDSLAKDEMLMQAENFHLSYHPFANNSGGGAQITGMKADRDHVDAHPGVGYSTGRGEGWGSDTMITAYAIADPAWRALKLPWFRDLAELLTDGQSTCNGFIQSQHMYSVAMPPGEPQQPTWFWRQLIEQSITENMMQGLRETVFKRADASYTDMLRDTLMGSLYAFISPLGWGPGEGAPWQYTAVGENPDPNAQHPTTVWCTLSQAQNNSSFDTYQDWSSFAYGYELTGDQLFLDYAEIQGWGTDVYGYLTNQGLSNIWNQAAILALLQRINGDL